ncbi:hypothetical protein BN890_38860 [Bacteroides xylanisolvens SD CC 1b]|uniref:Uncharacterized protein n=1 Tax=Bacteroides xylanisolvens SD CC 1b TaxID=702447 RepID=W6P971_9BACE|nr:hypothetical protein BN891_28070 [Bacteroides xylanisolvens SD CC 2a]CDM06283.1 hypothetical protein BN890_38860 [Bacteroides xylanisolvens SD CC 1b]
MRYLHYLLKIKALDISSFCRKCGNSLYGVEKIHISDFWNIFFSSHFNN